MRQKLSLGFGNIGLRAQQLAVDRTDIGDQPIVWLGQLAEKIDLPKPRMPISTTTARVVSSMRQRVSGRPSSLLLLPRVATTGPKSASIARKRSFVVVLPLEPVTATTGHLRPLAHQAAQLLDERHAILS